MSRRSALQAAALMVVAILLATLWPLPEQSYRASLSPVACLVCGAQGMQDVIQNVLMLLPLGVFLGLAGVRPARAALAGFALSFLVESLQYTVVVGRDASLSDVVTNTIGAALGAMLAPHLPGLLRPARQAAARLALAAVLVFAVAWVFGAWALGSDPGQGKWRGRAFNDFPDAPPFNGELVRASIDGSPLQVAPAPLPLDVEHAFARDSFTLRVAVRPGPPIAWRENVITIIDFRDDASDANNSLVMMLNRVRHRALLSFRINAARARLRTPSFNLGPAFDVPSGREVTLEVSRARGMLRAAAVRNGQPLTTEYRIGPELLWAVMAPRTPRPGLEWIVEAFLWPAALLLVAGYWTGRSGSRRVLLLAALLAILVQVATPPLFAVAGQSPLGWTMLLGALVLGALAGRRSLPADDSRVRTHDL